MTCGKDDLVPAIFVTRQNIFLWSNPSAGWRRIEMEISWFQSGWSRIDLNLSYCATLCLLLKSSRWLGAQTKVRFIMYWSQPLIQCCIHQASGIIPRQSVDSEVKILSCQWDKTFILSYKNLKIVIHVFPEPCLRACLSWRWKHCPTAPPDYWGKGQKEHDVWSINLYCEIQFKVSFMLQNICFRDLAGSPFDPPFQQL